MALHVVIDDAVTQTKVSKLHTQLSIAEVIISMSSALMVLGIGNVPLDHQNDCVFVPDEVARTDVVDGVIVEVVYGLLEVSGF